MKSDPKAEATKGIPSFNEHGIWAGPVEEIRSSSTWKYAEIRIAQTPRGWEFATSIRGDWGYGYGIGGRDRNITSSRDNALSAGLNELESEIIEHQQRFGATRDDSSNLKWIQSMRAEQRQPCLFEAMEAK